MLTEVLHQALDGPGRSVTQRTDRPPFDLFAVKAVTNKG